MFFRKVKRQEPKRKVSASIINDIAAAAEWAGRIRAAAPLTVQATPGGPLIQHTRPQPGFLAIANGAITARSGTTAGIGIVNPVKITAVMSGGVFTSCTLATVTSVSYPVYNPSSNTMTSGNGIDSGMYCFVEEFPAGYFCVSPLECS